MTGTRTFRLEKLVRDGIVPSTEAQGGIVDYEVVEGERKVGLLLDKLIEEVREFREGNSPNELAQMLGIIGALATEMGLSEDELRQIEAQRQAEVGGYADGHLVHTVTLPDDNEWTKYYAADLVRYPEIETKA